MTSKIAKTCFQARQGDVLILAEDLPADAQRAPSDVGKIVLARGEATGHAHVIQSCGAVPYNTPDRRHFVVIQGGRVNLEHDEHVKVSVLPGTYRIVRQREWQDEEIQNVAD
jgi:hypothetical protein